MATKLAKRRISLNPRAFFLEQLVVAIVSSTIFGTALLGFFSWNAGGRLLLSPILQSLTDTQSKEYILDQINLAPFGSKDQRLIQWLQASLALLFIQCFNWATTCARAYYRISRFLLTEDANQIDIGPDNPPSDHDGGDGVAYYWVQTERVGYSSLLWHVLTTLLLHLACNVGTDLLPTGFGYLGQAAPGVIIVLMTVCVAHFLLLWYYQGKAEQFVAPSQVFIDAVFPRTRAARHMLVGVAVDRPDVGNPIPPALENVDGAESNQADPAASDIDHPDPPAPASVDGAESSQADPAASDVDNPAAPAPASVDGAASSQADPAASDVDRPEPPAPASVDGAESSQADPASQ